MPLECGKAPDGLRGPEQSLPTLLTLTSSLMSLSLETTSKQQRSCSIPSPKLSTFLECYLNTIYIQENPGPAEEKDTEFVHLFSIYTK